MSVLQCLRRRWRLRWLWRPSFGHRQDRCGSGAEQPDQDSSEGLQKPPQLCASVLGNCTTQLTGSVLELAAVRTGWGVDQTLARRSIDDHCEDIDT